ncbi:MAG: hypothetical protein LBB38_01925 [Puniceicoccales bacterium]|jgi:hypothetical protein|nr:hypothetical protein [Puniceicoccales bacterium]
MDPNQQQQKRKGPPLKPVDPEQYSFDIGLVKITTYRKKKRPQPLPPVADIHPCVGKMEERLRTIIDLKTFESILFDVMRPDVKDRTLLVPVRFRQRVAKLRQSVGEAMANMHGHVADELDTLLSDLEEQLDADAGRNELLEQYRLMILLG